MTEPTPTPSPSPEVVGIRDEMATVNPGSVRYQVLAQRLESVYRQAHAEPAPAAAPSAAEAPRYEPPPNVAVETVRPASPDPAAAATSAFPDFAAPAGHALDASAVVDLRKMELTHDVPVAELTALTTEYTAAWERRGDTSEARLAQRDRVLLETWGDDFERELTRATEMAQRIPQRVLAHALQAGMHYDPVLWLKLSELWKKQHGR